MPKVASEPIPQAVTAGQLAQAIGVTERVIMGRKADGRLPVLPDGRVNFAEIVKSGVNAFAAASRGGSEAEGGPPDLSRERALLARAQREGQTMKNSVLKAELLPAEDNEAITGAALDAVRAKCMALPTKGAPLCLGLNTLNEAKEVLTGLVYDCLSDIASTAVVVRSASERAMRRIGSFGAPDETISSDGPTASLERKRVGRPPSNSKPGSVVRAG
jgi:hypothetical protein